MVLETGTGNSTRTPSSPHRRRLSDPAVTARGHLDRGGHFVSRVKRKIAQLLTGAPSATASDGLAVEVLVWLAGRRAVEVEEE